MNAIDDTYARGAELRFERPSKHTLMLALTGDWTIHGAVPSPGELARQLDASEGIQQVIFDIGGLERWDSALLTFVWTISDDCARAGVAIDAETLPPGVQRLLHLAHAVPERRGARRGPESAGVLARIGNAAMTLTRAATEMLAFVGEVSTAMLELLRGRARVRRSDLLLTLQACGVEALPIVSLVSVLVGLILAFIGAVQLVLFGAQIYVASLVGIAMVRVMAAVMVGVIMAGRTGAAFAAQLGTMQVNEEIDALRTLGISPVQFLVLPRMLALVGMTPLLCLYADMMGILGGMIVGVGLLDIGFLEYYHMTRASVGLNDLWIGLFHGLVFGVLVSLAGCLRGMQCGRSASAVGQAATSAVVTGIVSIVIATAIITLVCNVIGI